MTGVGFSGPSPGPSAVAGWRAAKSCLPCARRLATSSHLELKTALGGNSLVHGFRRGVDRASGRPKVPQPVSEGQGFPADWWSPLPSQRVLQVRLTAPRDARSFILLRSSGMASAGGGNLFPWSVFGFMKIFLALLAKPKLERVITTEKRKNTSSASTQGTENYDELRFLGQERTLISRWTFFLSQCLLEARGCLVQVLDTLPPAQGYTTIIS